MGVFSKKIVYKNTLINFSSIYEFNPSDQGVEVDIVM